MAKVTNYLSTLECQARFTAVAHSQTKGQAKAINKVIPHSLQKKCDNPKGKWADNGALWSIRTIEKKAMGETPFMLAYGSEVALPVEVALHTIVLPPSKKNSTTKPSERLLIYYPLFRVMSS